jgi:hypothetical protein
MAKKYSLQDSFEWLGEFWFEAEPDNHFPGILSYSPTAGVKLSTLREGMTQTGGETIEGGHTIYGSTIETGEITLLICHPRGNGVSNNTKTKEDFFSRAVVIGHHVSTEDKVLGCAFSFTNLDDFFRPSNLALEDSYSQAPVFSCKNNGDTLSIRKNGISTLMSLDKISPLLVLGGWVSSETNDNNVDFSEELDTCYRGLIEKHGIKDIGKKKNYFMKCMSMVANSTFINALIKYIQPYPYLPCSC